MLRVVRAVAFRDLNYFSSSVRQTRSISSLMINNFHGHQKSIGKSSDLQSKWHPGTIISSQAWRWETVRMAGHSKWQNIRHAKGAKDQQKSMTAIKMIQKINVAILEGGGTDPKYNSLLARVFAEAQSKNVPKTTIEAAMKRAKEKKDSNQRLVLSAVGPGSCFILIECLTDKQIKTKQEITSIIKKNGAKAADMKMASFSFAEKGFIHVTMEGNSIDMDRAEELAIEAGAEEVTEAKDDDQEIWKFVCDPMDLPAVKKNLEAENLPIVYSGKQYIATTYTKVNEAYLEHLHHLYDKLEAHTDVIKIYDNIEMD